MKIGKKFKSKSTLLIGVMILALTLGTYYFHRKNSQIEMTGDYYVYRQRIYEELEKGGLVQVLKSINSELQERKLTLPQCHTLLHVVGHKAYDYFKYDLLKIAPLVDDSCIYGFLHGIEGQIVFVNKDPVKILQTFCSLVKKNNAGIYCFHGAGHEFLATTNDYKASLLRCDKLAFPQSDSEACYGGVFSEFGNRVLNYDTDTGEKIPGPPQINFHYKHPMEFCATMSDKYQSECARQLLKMAYDYNDVEKSLSECDTEGLVIKAKQSCINTVGLFYSEQKLYKGNDVPLPNSVIALSDSSKIAFIRGVNQSVKNWPGVNAKEVANNLCKFFKDEKGKSICMAIFAN